MKKALIIFVLILTLLLICSCDSGNSNEEITTAGTVDNTEETTDSSEETTDSSEVTTDSSVEQSFTVSFNTHGGSAVESQTVKYGEKATVPEEPTYEGHRFVGWSLDASGSTPVDFDKPITSDVVYHAVWNKTVDAKGLLLALLSGYTADPLSYIPESMRYDFSANLVEKSEIVNSYSSFVDVDDIRYGHGEQWHMALDNILQTQTFFDILTVVDTLSSASIAAFNNYFDENPADTAHYEFESGIYNVTIKFDGEVIFYVLDYTAEFPVVGEQSVQIALSMAMKTGEKNVRMQIGDANALAYRVTESSYEFAIKYGGARRAMFSIEEDEDGNVSGRIFEYLTVAGKDLTASTAEFYITEDYVSVVGNKASGLIGFTGYITELYDVKSGKMIAYEVQETLSSIVYNTLWFNLDDVSGIKSFKYREKNGDTPAAVFVNGSSTQWEAKKVGGIGAKMLSRRFDIELRTQYVYSYDAATEEYVAHEIKVPMLFVQEENYDTLIDDVKSANRINISVTVNSGDLNKLLEDYDSLIPGFIETKDEITDDAIVEYIGERITFE